MDMRCNTGAVLLTVFFACYDGATMADEILLIDDRRTGDLESTLGPRWRLVTDGVMGGVSNGNLAVDSVAGKPCLRLRGNVRLENNGGFIQGALAIEDSDAADASDYQGLLLEVYGNNEQYNLHLRTADVWLPWQAYRASFLAPARWHRLKLPFKEFTGHQIGKGLDLEHLLRIGIVAIGQEFSADLCLAKLALYRETD